MAAKTLGIKFQVAGVKEAQASINSLRNNLNASLQQSKQTINTVASLDKTVGSKTSNPTVELISNVSQELSDWGDLFTKQLEKSLSASKSAARGFLGNAVTGFQEGVGNELARQYVEGVDQGLEGRLFKFYKNNGVRQGKFAGRVAEGVAKSPEAIQRFGLNKFFDAADIYFEGLKNKKDTRTIGIEIAKEIFNPKPFKRQFQQTIALSYDSVKSSVDRIRSKVGIGQMRDRKLSKAGYNELLKTLRGDSVKDIQVDPNAEEVVLVVGGFAGKKGRSGSTFAKQIAGMNPSSKSQYVGVRNDFTDVVNVREAYGGTEAGQIESIRKIMRMFKEVHKLGYNPDAIKLAAQTLRLQQQNPDKMIKLAGYSGGGYVVEDAMKLLKQFGADMSLIQGKGIATPNLPGSTKQSGFNKTLGEQDNIFEINSLKEINKKAKEIFGVELFSGLSEDIQNIKDIDNHFLDSYILFSEEVKEFLYGQNSNVESIIDIHKEIIATQSIIEQANQEIEKLLKGGSASFNPVAFEKLQQVYIKALKNLQQLGKNAKEKGGGSYYDKILKQSTESLNELGVSDERDISKEYKQYLDNISSRAENQADNKINGIIPDYKNLTIEGRSEALKSFKSEVQTRAKLFRKAIRDNDLKLARSLGENLLFQIQHVKKIYADLRKDVGSNKAIAGNLAELTKLETEVRTGQPNLKGRSDIGLENLVDNQLSASGENVVEGFVEGIERDLDAVQDAGSRIGDVLQEGTDENLGIASPAKRYIRKGYEVVKGFILGIRDGFNDVEEVGEELGEELSEGTSESTSRFKNFSESVNRRFPILGKLKGLLVGVSALFIGGMGINFATNLLNQLSKEVLSTAMAFESLDRAIVFVSRNGIEGMDNLNFISQEAKRLTVDLTEAKLAYAGLIGASRNTPLEGEQTKRLFSAFAAASANRGLDAQSQNRLFTALEQIIAKRKFSAEEVKGQIGDIRGFGDFQGILAQAMGVSSAELTKMMSQGEVGLDVVPKVVALIEAQNAAARGAQTAQQAQTQYNNSLTELKNTLGQLLQPFEKFKLNVLSGGLDLISEKLEWVFKLIALTGGVALLGMFGQINLVTIATVVWTKSINLLRGALNKQWGSKFKILAGLGKLAAAYALVTAAYLTWSNVLDLTKNQYQELEDGADSMAAGIDRYRQAIEAATAAQNNFNTEQGKLELKEGLKLPEWAQNIVGQERLNLDIVRRGLDWVYDRPGGKFLQYGSAALFMKDKFGSGNFTTEAERRDADRRVATGEVSFRAKQLLTESQPAIAAAEEINKFDAQIREIQAKRLELLPGDTEAMTASLKEERAINKQRDVQLKILTTYQQELQNAIAENKAVLALTDISDSERERTQRDLADTEDTLIEINGILSAVTKQLSEFQRQLRNSNERINNFIERRGLQAQSERSQIISEGVELREGDRVIQLKLEAASHRELTDYVAELELTIGEGRKRLESGALAEGYRLVSESASSNGLTLDSATIDRLLSSEGRSQGEKDALAELKALRENQTKLSQYREQLAQNLQANRNTLIDFNRTLDDYFFRLTQQIKEARKDAERLISQIFYTNIKNRLRSAIAPGSNTFVNGIIDNIQSVIDQASQVAQKVFGDSSAELGFESESRTLTTEMQDFIRQIGNAGDAVEDFVRRLDGVGEVRNESYFPVAGMTADTATITSGYGWRNIFGRRDFHEGIDIAARGGTAVNAVNSGTVRHIKPLADQTQVGIETAKGVMEWFIHLGQNLKVNQGDRVSAGQTIGYVAHTTQRARNARVSTGDHLDYRVKVNGK